MSAATSGAILIGSMLAGKVVLGVGKRTNRAG